MSRDDFSDAHDIIVIVVGYFKILYSNVVRTRCTGVDHQVRSYFDVTAAKIRHLRYDNACITATPLFLCIGCFGGHIFHKM